MTVIVSDHTHLLFCQVGPRSGPTEIRSLSGFKQVDTLIVFMEECFEKEFDKKT